MNESCRYPHCMQPDANGSCPHLHRCRPSPAPLYALVEVPACHERTDGAGPPLPPACPPAPVDACGSPIPNPRRPDRPAGHDTGRHGDSTGLTKDDLDNPPPNGVWGGPRAHMPVPWLMMRANAGDFGARPLPGPFWESPDIFILAGVHPAAAPDLPPPPYGDIALADQPNTLYAHVWNFGHGAAPEVMVEFYWCDPSLGVNPSSLHLLAQVPVTLGSKCSGKSHALVKCPVPWRPAFLNGGHECLLVRIWDNTSDLPGGPRFDAARNRHVGQRNIHVVTAQPVLGAVHALLLAPHTRPRTTAATSAARAAPGPAIVLKVGPLFQEPAQVRVERVAPNLMPWLQLRTGKRGQFPANAVPTGQALLSRPFASGSGMAMASSADRHCVSGEDQEVTFTSSDVAPANGQAHVYRVTATQGGVLFGGYTVVIMGA